jgi:hypothetical protein
LRLYLRQHYGAGWHRDLRLIRSGSPSLGARKRTRDGGSVFSPARVSALRKLERDADIGVDILKRFANSSFMDWEAGSTLVFWRWDPELVATARDGMPAFIDPYVPLPRRKKPATKPPVAKYKLYLAKLRSIIQRGYVWKGKITGLTDYFGVDKADDIRMVYNGSSCGLNRSLWAPNFWLPTPDTALNLLDFGSYSVDLDLGEMFLNFPLSRDLRQESGIDLTPFKSDLEDLFDDGRRTKRRKVELSQGEKTRREEEEKGHTLWLRWERNWMGSRPSPHSSVRFCYLAEEFVRGDPAEADGPLRWDDVILNLPGDPNYDPSRPRVMKWDFHEDRLAGDFVAFVDDLRASGASEEHAWAVAMRISKRLQYLGMQNAARKTRPPHPGTRSLGGGCFSRLSTGDSQDCHTGKVGQGEGVDRRAG